MNTRDLLREEVNSQVNQLKTLELGTDTYDKTVSGICKMIDKISDIDKLDIERDRVEIEEVNISIENEKIKSEKSDRKTKNIISGAGLGLTAFGLVAMFVFEERGTITTQAGRKVLDRLFRTK